MNDNDVVTIRLQGTAFLVYRQSASILDVEHIDCPPTESIILAVVNRLEPIND